MNNSIYSSYYESLSESTYLRKGHGNETLIVTKVGHMGQGDGLATSSSAVQDKSHRGLLQVNILDCVDDLDGGVPHQDTSLIQNITSNNLKLVKAMNCI